MSIRLGTTLRLARVAKELTQKELADRSGVSQSLITKIENSRVSPSRSIRLSLAKALGQPADIFMTSTEIEKEEKKAGLVSMLMRCGVNEKAASLIVKSVRDRSLERIRNELDRNGKEMMRK
jgi:transcriptional regulator with XRE-family HTH domain